MTDQQKIEVLQRKIAELQKQNEVYQDIITDIVKVNSDEVLVIEENQVFQTIHDALYGHHL